MAYQIKVSKDAEKDILTAKCHYRITKLEGALILILGIKLII